MPILSYRHPASVHCVDASPSGLRIASVHNARSSLGRFGADFASRWSGCAFPALGRYDPANAASASLRWPSLTAFAGRHRAAGLRHAAAIQAAVLRDLSSVAASSRNSRDALRVRRLVVLRTPRVPYPIQAGGIVPLGVADFLSANEKRQRIG